jgi:hypothetical protein
MGTTAQPQILITAEVYLSATFGLNIQDFFDFMPSFGYVVLDIEHVLFAPCLQRH